MNADVIGQAHEIKINKRNSMTISGVKEVDSFDDRSVEIQTVCGSLNVEGENIKIEILDVESGIVSLNGKIDAVFYYDDAVEGKKGFLGRLFK